MALKAKRIGFIGVGKMGAALARGIVAAGLVDVKNVILYDICADTLKFMEKEGYKIAQSNAQVIKSADYIILAVKPQTFNTMDGESYLSPKVCSEKTFISIMAGIDTKTVQHGIVSLTGKSNAADIKCKVIRVATNTPCQIGKAASAIYASDSVDIESINDVKSLMSAVGVCCHVKVENELDAVVAMAGCGPATIYTLIEAMATAGVKAGLRHDVAVKLAAQTVAGAGEMVLNSNRHPASLRDDVCSPGGLTVCLVAELEKCGFRNSIISATEAALERGNELK